MKRLVEKLRAPELREVLGIFILAFALRETLLYHSKRLKDLEEVLAARKVPFDDVVSLRELDGALVEIQRYVDLRADGVGPEEALERCQRPLAGEGPGLE